MKHAVIDCTFGALAIRDTAPDWPALIGPEGTAPVHLDPSLRMSAWVNDLGFADPVRYPRNIVGSCLLVAMGAPLQPYAGTVVLTGATWDAPLDMPEDALRRLHDRVRRAVDDRPVPLWDREFTVGMREVARHVRLAPAPRLLVTPAKRGAV